MTPTRPIRASRPRDPAPGPSNSPSSSLWVQNATPRQTRYAANTCGITAGDDADGTYVNARKTAHSAHAAHRLTVTTESPRKLGKYSTDRYSPSEAPAAADSIARSGAGVAWVPVAPLLGLGADATNTPSRTVAMSSQALYPRPLASRLSP